MALLELITLIVVVMFFVSLVHGNAGALFARVLKAIVDLLLRPFTKVWRSEGDPAGVIGLTAEVKRDVVSPPDGEPPTGKVFTRGELWSAIPRDSETRIRVGERVRVVSREDGKLVVERQA